jgi:hypothetical protein
MGKKIEAEVWWGNLQERDQDLGVDGTIILKRNFKKYDSVDWIDLAQDRDKWRAVVKAVMNLRVQ